MIHNIQWSISVLKEIWTQKVTLCILRSVNFPPNATLWLQNLTCFSTPFHSFIPVILFHYYLLLPIRLYKSRPITSDLLFGPLNIINPQKNREIVLLDCTVPAITRKRNFSLLLCPTLLYTLHTTTSHDSRVKQSKQIDLRMDIINGEQNLTAVKW